MPMNTPITQHCEQLLQGVNDALTWVNDNVSEADGKESTVKTLKEQRRLAKRLLYSAQSRPAMAVFGASQTGKSYLVSNLARLPDSSNLKIMIGNEEVDFLEDINPPGSGESTGTITRFTTASDADPNQPPVYLKLLSQVDLVKILANGYFSDLEKTGREKIDEKPDFSFEAVRSLFTTLANTANPQAIDGLTEEDIYELKEYFKDRFASEPIIRLFSTMGLWDDMAQLVPRLPVTERWRVFELFWGKLPSFNNLFNKLVGGLHQLGFARKAYCGKEALIPKLAYITDEKGRQTQASNTIIDVKIFQYLMKNDPLKPLLVHGDTGQSDHLERSLITALISEVVLTLPPRTATHEKRQLFKDGDVLDFPGARSRENLAISKLASADSDDIKYVFLRGKVAYLFEDYAYYKDQISSLAFCSAPSNQEVKELPKLIGDWVFRTHGKTPAERSKLLTSLFVIFTKFDIELKGNPSQEKLGQPKTHDYHWKARLEINFEDEMEKSVEQNWPSYWDNNGAFKNCFWMRDPQYSDQVFDEFGEVKTIRPNYVEKLADKKMSFTGYEAVKRHFHNPAEAWDAASTAGNSGVEYIIEKITPTCTQQVKNKQVNKLFTTLQQDIYTTITPFYKDGDLNALMNAAKKEGDTVARAIVAMMKKTNKFGLLMNELCINDDLAWQSYFDLDRPIFKQAHVETETAVPVETRAKSLAFEVDLADDLADLWEEDELDGGNEELPTNTPKYVQKSELFAEALISKWKAYLQSIYQSEERLTRIGLEKEICQKVIQGITKSARRVGLKKRIADTVHNEMHTAANIHLIARLATLQINKMVNSVGWAFVPESERPQLKGGLPIFASRTISSPQLPHFSEGFAGQHIFTPWVVGLRQCYTANASYELDFVEIDVEANQRLGDILTTFRAH